MKNVLRIAFLSMALWVLTGCNTTNTEGVSDTETTSISTEMETTETMTYANYISVLVGEDIYSIGFNDQESSVFDLIVESEINIVYESTDFGPMITGVNDYQADTFHWIGFTKNGVFATQGLDTIDYGDGDIFEFTENLSDWQQNLNMVYEGRDDHQDVFKYGDTTVLIASELINLDLLLKGETYQITGNAVDQADIDIIFNASSIKPAYDGYIQLVMNDISTYLTYHNDDDHSVFDLIEQSNLEMTYQSTDFGPFITEIGPLKADDFFWLGFTKNGEFAMEGLDQIAYQSGDTFTFTENLVTWQVTIEAELMAIEEDHLVFENNQQSFKVYHIDLDESVINSDLTLGFIYQLTGIPSELTVDGNYIFNPTLIDMAIIDDFTQLYQLEIGQIFMLELTVSYVEESSAFGYEIFATDINGLSSTEISSEMPVSSDTDYIFYTIPDDYPLEIGQTYIGKFIYQVNEPSTVPQITLYEFDLNGDSLDLAIIIK
jgi:hypothetical protein